MQNFDDGNNRFYTRLSDLYQDFLKISPTRLLVLRAEENSPFPELPKESSHTEVRSIVDDAALELPDGLFVIKTAGQTWALISSGGLPELEENGSADSTRLLPGQQSHLTKCKAVFDRTWLTARRRVESISFVQGDWVEVVGSGTFGQVVHVNRTLVHDWVNVRMNNTIKSIDAEELRKLAGDPQNPEVWIAQKPADQHGLTNVLTWAKLKNALSDTLYSFAATKTVFRPYQFIPAMKMLQSESGRLLVADEVGLGKTIEAGLIWAELEQRQEMNRVLIVAPASLMHKWRMEMRRRFMREVDIWKKKDLKNFVDSFAESRTTKCAAVMSSESLRGARDLQTKLHELDIEFDLIIVDEAHQARNRGTKAFTLAQNLGVLADKLLFLSATPLSLGNIDFFNLMHLLEPDMYSDEIIFSKQIEPNKFLNEISRFSAAGDFQAAIESAQEIQKLEYGAGVVERPSWKTLLSLLHRGVTLNSRGEKVPASLRADIKDLCMRLNTLGSSFTRTRKRDIPNDSAIRSVTEIPVEWTPEERAFYIAVEEHYREQARLSNRPAAFTLQMPLRQTCSSIPVMQSQLRNRGLGHLADIAEQRQETFAESQDFDDVSFGDDENSEAGLDEIVDETLGKLAEQRIYRDTKLEALREHLKKLPEIEASQALIFTYSRGTVNYLAEALSKEYRVGFLHGGVKPDDREKVIDDFRNGRYDILVANQVGSEGLDFQFCKVLVNYDMPWNPMQVEQRIGRIDRFGQDAEVIYIWNMSIPDTIETEIYLRLYNRINLFKDYVGDLEPILQEVFEEVTRELVAPRLSPEALAIKAEEKSVQIETQKRIIEELQQKADLQLLDYVDISDFKKTPPNGRFIGEGELQSLALNVIRRYGAELVDEPNNKGIFQLKGSVDLGRALGRLASPEMGTIHNIHFAGKVRSQAALRVTFNSANLAGQAEDIDIVSSRHPLIRLAISEETEATLLPKRFGRCAFNSESDKGTYILNVSYAESSGVAPRKELWVTSLDPRTGQRNLAVESLFMEKVAQGELSGSEIEIPNQFGYHLQTLQGLTAARQSSEDTLRKQENSALVGTRKKSALQLIERKINRFSTALAQGAGIKAINEAQLRKAHIERFSIAERFDDMADTTLILELIAIALVEVR